MGEKGRAPPQHGIGIPCYGQNAFIVRPVPTAIDKAALVSKLRPVGQEHLLRYWDDLPLDERSVLVAEIMAVDFNQIARLVQNDRAGVDWKELAGRAEPPPAIRLDGAGSEHSFDEARARGEEALRAGELAVVLVAGGQGTRLGFDHPKGMYPIGPVSQHSLFQILLEKVLATSRRYRLPIPLCVMTSPATHDETVEFLQAHGHFGLPAGDVRVFCQGTMPAIDLQTGKLLLAERGRLALSPDGHGGLLRAMAPAGILGELAERGVQQLFYMQVDNPLVIVCDPVFVGHHLLAGSEMSTQVVAKRDPLDRVGNFVSVDSRARIIEYSDLPDDAARRKNDDESLALWAGNIAVHVLDLAFLQHMAAAPDSLPFHRAKKKVPYINENGKLIEPERENAFKFERFIFDLLPSARNAIAVEVDEAECFAPLKNGPGAAKDSPEIVKQRMVALHRSWLLQAGAEIASDATVEISPLFALDAEEVARRIQPGTSVAAEAFFGPPGV